MSYLKWAVQVRHTYADQARAELERRGTVEPDLDVAGHAIDRASLRCRKHWHHYSEKGEGLWTWLQRAAREAYDKGLNEEGKVDHLGIRWTFDDLGVWPLLKTVYRKKDPPEKGSDR
jgi:hypothetical protein